MAGSAQASPRCSCACRWGTAGERGCPLAPCQPCGRVSPGQDWAGADPSSRVRALPGVLHPQVSHSLRDLSSLLPSVSSELLGDELVPASLPSDSASRTVPQHSLSAKAQPGCSAPGHHSPRHPRGPLCVPYPSQTHSAACCSPRC